jgi:hypothetical protein
MLIDYHSAAEITLLEAAGRDCVMLPTTTPTPVPTEPLMTMSQPTSSQPPIPTPPRRLKSGILYHPYT